MMLLLFDFFQMQEILSGFTERKMSDIKKKKKKQHSDTQFTYDNDAGLNHSDACSHSDEEDGDLTHPVEINNPPVVKMVDS